MKTSARRRSQSSKALLTAGIVGGFVVVSGLLGALILRAQDTRSLAAGQASANQLKTITCESDIRVKFDQNLREGNRWSITGENPEGVYARDGRLYLQANKAKKTAKIDFTNWVKGNFAYQTRFNGFETSPGADAGVSLDFPFYGESNLALKINRVDGSNSGTVWYTNPNGSLNTSSPAFRLPEKFKVRMVRHGQIQSLYIKDVTQPLDEDMKLVFLKTFSPRSQRAPGSVRITNDMTDLNADAAEATSSAVFENFRIFCPGNSPEVWRRDIAE